MKNNIEERNLYLFLACGADKKYFCKSFFPEEKTDYTRNQASWTMLYKKKYDIYEFNDIAHMAITLVKQFDYVREEIRDY